MHFRIRALVGNSVENVHAIDIQAALKHAKLSRFSPARPGSFKQLLGYAFHGKTQFSITQVD